MMYWVWVAAAYHADKHQAWTRFTIWLVLGLAAAVIWCRLMWIIYLPKKPEKK